MHKVKVGEETPHLILHYIAAHDAKAIRLRVLRFAQEHKDYTAQVASGILSKKGQTLENYLWCMAQDKTPFDEIFIFLASVCFKNTHEDLCK